MADFRDAYNGLQIYDGRGFSTQMFIRSTISANTKLSAKHGTLAIA